MISHSAPAEPAWRRWLERYGSLLLLLAVICLIAGVRIRLRDCPIERDEGEYAYMGQLMLQGIPPYQLAYNMKFPGTYASYAVIMAVFGQTPAGIHLGALCVTTLTALMIYWLGRSWLDEFSGAIAGAFCACLLASPSMYGLAAHATLFAALFTTAGTCFLFASWPRRDLGRIFCSGLMFGTAVLMKQQAAPLALWGLAVVVFHQEPSRPKRNAGQYVLVFSSAVLLPFGLVCLILARAGVFGNFWFWTISYAREYISLVNLAGAWRNLQSELGSATFTCTPIWLTALVGLVTVWFTPLTERNRLLVLSFLGASFLTTCPGFFFRTHYFLLMVPALAVIAAGAIGALRHLPRSPFPAAVPGVTCVLVVAWTAYGNRAPWFEQTPREVVRSAYGPSPYPEAVAVSEFIRSNSLPSDLVAVLGSEPEIYFLSQRHSATGYIYMYPLMEPQAFARRMQAEMIHEIETKQPRFVVLATANLSWMQSPESDTLLLDWWGHSYQSNYSLCGIAEVISTAESTYVWGEDARHYQPTHGSTLMVFQRRTP